MEKNQRLLVNMMHLVVVFVMVFLVSSCISEKQENTITVALFQAPASEALIRLIPEFERLRGVKVNYEILPYADLKAKVEQQFFANSGDYDVIMADCI